MTNLRVSPAVDSPPPGSAEGLRTAQEHPGTSTVQRGKGDEGGECPTRNDEDPDDEDNFDEGHFDENEGHFYEGNFYGGDSDDEYEDYGELGFEYDDDYMS